MKVSVDGGVPVDLDEFFRTNDLDSVQRAAIYNLAKVIRGADNGLTLVASLLH